MEPISHPGADAVDQDWRNPLTLFLAESIAAANQLAVAKAPLSQGSHTYNSYDWQCEQKCVLRWVTRIRSTGAPQRGQGCPVC
jgi:hypothetical protein